MDMETYRAIEGVSRKFGLFNLILIVLIGAGLLAAHYMDTHGHHVTGMSNQIVWGLPHIFAILLIVSASGALNVASMASVFGRDIYKPLARLSGLLAISLLMGGLVILVLDLGRPDRIVIAMTHYNFKSLFTWNIFLYTGFVLITSVYLCLLMERRLNRYVRSVGVVAFVWRIVLTTGTGCIFGFLVARESYETAILAPLFVATSLLLGLAVFILVTITTYRGAGYASSKELLNRLRRLLGIFAGVVLFLVVLQHLTHLYAFEHQAMERFFLFDTGLYPTLFWVGQLGVGIAIPMTIAFSRRFEANTRSLLLAAALVVAGGFCQLYVLIIGAQAYPMPLSRKYEILESAFFDGVVATYTPSMLEIALGIGGIAFSLLLYSVGLKIFRCLPDADLQATR